MSTASTNTTSTNNTTDWRELVEEQAQRLEAGAGLIRLLAIANDEIDAVRFASDLMAAVWHRDQVLVARQHGQRPPKPPAPVSKLLTGLAEQMREKLLAVSALLPDSIRERLRAIAPAIQAALDAQDDDVVEMIWKLLPESPERITVGLIFGIDRIEQRFAP